MLNTAPSASDDSFSLDEDQEFTTADPGDVLDNDSDFEGDGMTVTLVSGPSDADNFVLNSDGTFEYCPISDWDGTDSFVYKVSDGIDSAQATATISSMQDMGTSISKKTGSPGSGEGSAGAPAGGYQELGNDDVVTVWDNDDGERDAGIADSSYFSDAADFGTQIGTHTWADLVSQLTTYAQNNGLINEIYILTTVTRMEADNSSVTMLLLLLCGPILRRCCRPVAQSHWPVAMLARVLPTVTPSPTRPVQTSQRRPTWFVMELAGLIVTFGQGTVHG